MEVFSSSIKKEGVKKWKDLTKMSKTINKGQ